jgi:hypothetical protein
MMRLLDWYREDSSSGSGYKFQSSVFAFFLAIA